MGKQSKKKKARRSVPKLLKLDLGCGQNKTEGFTGVDLFKVDGVDIVHDLFKFPWPFENGSVEQVHCSHFFEHVPGLLRGKWMDELYRILVPCKVVDGQPVEGFARVTVPYGLSVRATQDFTHEWPPLTEFSFQYFNKGWREANKLTHGHYDLKCDFDFSWVTHIDVMWGQRDEQARTFAMRHYQNVISDITVVLTKRAPNA